MTARHLMRIRTIKPDFYSDEDLCELPALTRILFTGLWGLADREGRLEYRPKFIKVKVLPYDEADISVMLESLRSCGFIQIYEVSGREYVQIISFRKHQRIMGKESETESELPSPPPERRASKKREKSGNTGENSGINGEAPENAGRERKGKERKGKENAPESPVALIPGRRDPPLQTKFVEGFQAVYQEVTGQPFKIDKHHWVIASRLVKAYGYEPCVEKARILGEMCRDRSSWFTKDGYASFTLETLSNKWNNIIQGGAQTKEDEFIAELRKQEALRADFNNSPQ